MSPSPADDPPDRPADPNRLTSEMLVILTHRLNTPLTVILGHVQLLQRRIRLMDGSDQARLLPSLAIIERVVKAAAEELEERARAPVPPPAPRPPPIRAASGDTSDT